MNHNVSCLLFSILFLNTFSIEAADSLKPLVNDLPPQSVEELWADYDPRAEPLKTTLIREWVVQDVVIRYVIYDIGTFKATPARMAAFYVFPQETVGKLPALLHMHGGGQRAYLRGAIEFARRGYAVLSVNWGGREMETAETGDANTNWGAVDPTQSNVSGYASLLPKENTIDAVESPRNNNWFLLTVGCRRGITFLEQQTEVDAERIGIMGHSMGGRLTGLIAGSDKRVKAASPSVGGSGFLQYNMWGLAGSARRVNGSMALFRNTIAGEAYLPHVTCPILYLSATNDFNAPMEFVEQGMKQVPHDNKRTTYAIHLNHRFTLDAEVSRKLWFDAHLQHRLTIPATANAELILNRDTGIPVYRVKPDMSREIAKVEIYYGYERDPRNRFWTAAKISRKGGVWEGECPVHDLDEPLFVLGSVSYRLTETERRENDPETFLLSVADSVYPKAMKEAGIKATEKHRRLIDDFSRRYQDWYLLSGNNRHHWFFSTRKLVDPRWSGPKGGKLVFNVTTFEPDNTLGVQVETDRWRSYAKRQPKTYTALIPLQNSGQHHVVLSVNDFQTEAGESLADWDGITELILSSAKKLKPDKENLSQWNGAIPTFSDLHWEGGKIITRPKPYPQNNGNSDFSGGLADPEFLKAIEKSLK